MSRKRLKYRAQLVSFLLCLGCLLAVTAGINYYFDPLLRFRAVRTTNRIVPVIDSRLQKTNRLLQSREGYDAVLLGSSRVEQFRGQDFRPLRVMNYAVPSFYPDEAGEYLELFLQQNGGKPVVFLGLDFYGSNSRAHEHSKSPRSYIETCQSPLYSLKSALSGDTLKYSYRVFHPRKEMFKYDRLTLDKIPQRLERHESDELVKKHLELYKRQFYGDYVYNAEYALILQRLKNRHPELRFVVFTTPVTAEMFALMVRCGRMPDYERWLNDIVSVFGSVYNFMFISRLTSDRNNFMDAHHLYPEKATPVTRTITGHPTAEDAGVGCLVNAANLQQHLADVRRQAVLVREDQRP